MLATFHLTDRQIFQVWNTLIYLYTTEPNGAQNAKMHSRAPQPQLNWSCHSENPSSTPEYSFCASLNSIFIALNIHRSSLITPTLLYLRWFSWKKWKISSNANIIQITAEETKWNEIFESISGCVWWSYGVYYAAAGEQKKISFVSRFWKKKQWIDCHWKWSMMGRALQHFAHRYAHTYLHRTQITRSRSVSSIYAGSQTA